MTAVRQALLIFHLAALVGCGHYQHANFCVVNSKTGVPVEGAKLSTDFVDGYSITLTDLIRPQWSYTQPQEATTGSEGTAAMKVPLGRTIGLSVMSPDGRKLDPHDHTYTEVTATKTGFRDASVSHTNNEWRHLASISTPELPITIRLEPK
jgi:hypothetical protein